MSGEQNLGEQALDKVAEIALSSQMDEVEDINVDIRTDPGKLVQGKLDSVAVSGEGMTIKQDLRVEAIGINTNAVAINPLKAVLGEIELTQSTDAQAQVLLTEVDLNRALSSAYLRDKMKNLEIDVQGELQVIDVQQASLQLPKDDEMALDVEIMQRGSGERKQLSAVTKPILKDDGYRIELEILSAEGQGLSLEFVSALLERIAELLDLRNFDLKGSTLQLKDFHVRPGKILLRGNMTIDQTLLES
jgi:LmeA-like phospholipid-binding